jgi:hypothetical protein
MSISSSCAEAFSEGKDYFEELVGPYVEIGKLVEKLEDIPDGYSYFEIDLVYRTYEKQYLGTTNIGGYEQYNTFIGRIYKKGYHMMSPKEYEKYVSGFEVIKREDMYK